MERELFNRAELLLGTHTMQRLKQVKVLIVGVGGVGSWCAENLVRTGIVQLTILDSDRVCASNVNRQLMATTRTIGQVKVEALKQHLLEINPHAQINALKMIYCEETANEFDLNSYDYVIDAIDSLKDKALLILNATQSSCKFFSSMGAALKIDPTKVGVAEFWKVKGDPLAKALRNKFKKEGVFPRKKFKCVYSEEVLKNIGTPIAPEAESLQATGSAAIAPQPEKIMSSKKAQINGSLMHITAIFGLTIGGLILQDIVEKSSQQN